MSLDRFKRVTRSSPCPVCGKPDWCLVSLDGAVAICMRSESSRPMESGGWLHRLRDDPPAPLPPPPPPPSRPRLFDASAYFSSLRLSWSHFLADGLSLSLGVSMSAIDRLPVAYDDIHDAFAFPMRDASGAIIGVRLRNNDGRKWAVGGSRQGLFFDPALALGGNREVFIFEGPTDTLAGLSLDLPSVGRPSCSGSADDLLALLRRLGARLASFVLDNDPLHKRTDGSTFRPGVDGFSSLCARLRIPWRIVKPPCKDFRSWVCSGLDRPAFDNFLRYSSFHFPNLKHR